MAKFDVRIDSDAIDKAADDLWDYTKNLELNIYKIMCDVQEVSNPELSIGADIDALDEKSMNYFQNDYSPHKIMQKSLYSYVEWLHAVADAYRRASESSINCANLGINTCNRSLPKYIVVGGD